MDEINYKLLLLIVLFVYNQILDQSIDEDYLIHIMILKLIYLFLKMYRDHH